MIETEYLGIKAELRCHYSVCDSCGSEQTDSNQSTANKDIMLRFRKAVDSKSIRIVCAANRYANGLILSGVRHWDEIMHSQAEYIDEDRLAGEEQGFLDQLGNFYGRKSAFIIASENGQIRNIVGSESTGILFSENIY